MSECSSCGARIVWATTKTGRSMPVDAAPSPEGNVELVDLLDGGREAVVVSEAERAGRRLHLSHFVTCPSAAQHRRSRA